MNPLPANDLRQNVITLAVPPERLPAIGHLMTQLLPPEQFDPTFSGQALETTYFDTTDLRLRNARLKKSKYLTLRIRRYPPNVYAISVKSEVGKYRIELPESVGWYFTTHGVDSPALGEWVPADFLARLLELTDDERVIPVVCVTFTRFAVENEADRLTLDVGISTNTGKCFPTSILENKTTARPAEPMKALQSIGLPPVKLSKFLWATTYGAR